jgi:hypothetical protein
MGIKNKNTLYYRTMAPNSFAAPHRSNNLELALQRRLAKPPTPASSWERETGRGIGQYSFGEYRLPVQIKVRSDEVVISEDCSLIATRVWDCSVVTAKWMEHLMNQKQQCHLSEALHLKTSNPEKVQILELGAGTGLLSIYLAKSGGAVLSTEYGSAVKYLKNNCDRNQVTLPSDQMTSTVTAGKVHCRELDWYKTTEETLQTLFQEEGERAMFDLIVVTDCSLTFKESQGVLEMIHKYGTPGHTKVVAGFAMNEKELLILSTTRGTSSIM